VLDPSSGPGWFAVGDAAATFDPLSSGGLYFAQTSGSVAAECLLEAQGEGSYAARLEPLLEAYIASRRKVYARENRFTAYSFWRRRQSGQPDFPFPNLAARGFP
jgi:flavin-dependent dehydrogenase